jgi:sulfur carrier protein
MTILLNGEPLTVEPGMSVGALLERLNLSNSPCAVEVNRELVPRASHPSRVLAEGDAVEVVTLVGGG